MNQILNMYWLYYLSIWLILSPLCSSVFHASGNCSLQSHKNDFQRCWRVQERENSWISFGCFVFLLNSLHNNVHKNKCIQGLYAHRAVSLGFSCCPQIRRQSGSFCYTCSSTGLHYRKKQKVGKGFSCHFPNPASWEFHLPEPWADSHCAFYPVWYFIISKVSTWSYI